MKPKEELDRSAHYNTPYYQDTVRLERECINGMSEDAVYKTEAEFALRSAGVNASSFGPNEGILDLASGAGTHIQKMSDALGNKVPIRGIDRAEELVKIGNEKLAERTKQGIREQAQLIVGDMSDVASALKNEKLINYKLITVLGSSLGYFNMHTRRAALEQMFNLLLPGGKLVIQFREGEAFDHPLRKKVDEERARKGYEIRELVVDGEKIHEMRNNNRGDAVRTYWIDSPHPDPEHADDYEEFTEEGGKKRWRDKDGFEYEAFTRVYFPDADGNEEIPLEPTIVDSAAWKSENKNIMFGMLNKVGFTDVELHPLPNEKPTYLGAHKVLSYVATKPADYVHPDIQKQIDFHDGRN